MSLLVGRIKFLPIHFRKFRLINLWTATFNNLLNVTKNVNNKKYSIYTDLSLPDDSIKKYLNFITDVYVGKCHKDNEISSIIGLQEVENLLDNRIQIQENMRNLEELGREDEDLKKLGHEEYSAYQIELMQLDEKLLNLILDNVGKDDCNNVIFEIVAGVGGQESMIFASDLLTMYRRYFDHAGFEQNLIDLGVESGIGGVRNASIILSGQGAFELLRHEGGVHRVQRVPATEKHGRMQTSTASVAVLPEPSDIEINIKDKDLKIDTKRSSGAGGQSVNKTESAIRITHLPTGIVVEAQSERAQTMNRSVAMMKLRAKLYDMQLKEQNSTIGTLRKSQRGLGTRNEKIRTYNFSHDRVIDHRLPNGTLNNLKGFMEGGESLLNLQKRLQRNYQLNLIRNAIQNCQ